MPRPSRALGLALAVLFALLPPVVAAAQTATDTAPEARPRIGLVLGGGGALGAAHVGVIQVLERLGIPVDIVTGTSMGAVVGGLYASGRTGPELAAILAEVDWVGAFRNLPPRDARPYHRKREDFDYLVDTRLSVRDDGTLGGQLGLIQGQRIGQILKRLTLSVDHIEDFDALPRPFRAVAVDVETGRPVVLGTGHLPVAMRASMSVPGAFPPVEIDGRWLLDGGVVNNLPVDVARAMGADRLIVVNLPASLSPHQDLTSPLAVLGQMVSVAIDRNTADQVALMQPGDILIEPDLGDLGPMDFGRVVEAAERGARAAEAQEAALRRLAADLQRLRAPSPSLRPEPAAPAAPTPPAPTDVRISDIRSDGDGTLSDAVILGYISQPVGAPLDLDRLERDLAMLYGLDLFERVDWDLDPTAGGDTATLVIITRARSWGTDSIEFGAGLTDDFQGNASYSLSAAYTFRPLNDLGGALRLAAEIGDSPSVRARLIQPLESGHDWIATGQASLERDVRRLFTETRGRQPGRYQLSVLRGDASVSRVLDAWGAVRGGLRLSTGWIEPEFSGDRTGSGRLNGAEVFAGLTVDTLDSVTWPSDGTLATLELRESLPALGADAHYRQVGLDAWTAIGWGPNIVLPRLSAGYTLDGEAPIQALFDLGGFLSLSGYDESAFLGQNRLFGAVTYMRRLTDSSFSLLDVPLYAGASLEAGNIWDGLRPWPDALRYSGSVFVGADTSFGPAYLGVGMAALDRQAVFLRLGRPF
jgi:NTE family protein